MNIPSESAEGEKLANWLRVNNYTFSHIVNEWWLPYKIIGQVAKKWALQWKSAWVPDYIIILKRKSLLFIELKRSKKVLKNWKLWASPSKVKPEQINWVNTLNTIQNVEAHICYWFEEAITKIQEIEVAP